MCLTPISLFHRSVEYHEACSYVSYEVPCSNCDECRSLQRLEWETRIAFELAYTKQIGGYAVFLTFTYNDNFLPKLWLRDGIRDVAIPCFDGDHVLQFLDQLNNYMQYFYGKESYKYFIAAEYGKNTRRPHYHGLFFLRGDVRMETFVETCRELWLNGKWSDLDSKNLGFVFPKFDPKRNCYVDSYGEVSSPLLKGFDPASGVPLYAGSKYVSKYVTKDLSYFNLNPLLEKVYKEDKTFKKTYRRFLPKHWQSNGIGYSIFKHLDFDNYAVIDDLIQNGIANPLDPTKKRMPLPSFVVNKLMYKNVLSDRISPTTGKRLYDRELSKFGKAYLKQSYVNKVNRVCERMSSVFQYIKHNENCLLLNHNLIKCGISDVCNPKNLQRVAIYHVLLKHLSPLALKNYEDIGTFEDFFNIDYSYNLYKYAKVSTYARNFKAWNVPEEYSSATFDYYKHAFEDIGVSSLDSIFCDTSRRLSSCRCDDFRRKQEQKDYTRYLFKYRYDKTLC